MERLGINPPDLRGKTWHERRLEFVHWAKDKARTYEMQQLERIQSLERLESLERLDAVCDSYEHVEIPEHSIVLCDIPYIDTNPYNSSKQTFNHDKFYDWVRNSNQTIFVCEYTMPPDFYCIKEIAHRVSMDAKTKNKTIERLFVHESKIDRVPKTTLF